MILQALVEYYEALERKEKITSPGWCRARVAYGLDISEQGELMGVIPLKKEQQNGKKTVWVPQDLTVPQMVSRSSGVSANFLCDHSGYMLGIDNKGKPERSRECFECAKKKHKDILGNISSPAARAVCRFFDCWAPDRAAENPYLMPELEEIISGSNLVVASLGKCFKPLFYKGLKHFHFYKSWCRLVQAFSIKQISLKRYSSLTRYPLLALQNADSALSWLRWYALAFSVIRERQRRSCT